MLLFLALVLAREDRLPAGHSSGRLIVDRQRHRRPAKLPRFKAYTNFDNYVPLTTWTKIAINNTEVNDQGAFDAGNNRFVAPAAGTYLFGASLLYKVNARLTRPSHAHHNRDERPAMTSPRSDAGSVLVSDSELEAMLARRRGRRAAGAQRCRARRQGRRTDHPRYALALRGIQFVRRTAVQTAVHVITTGASRS